MADLIPINKCVVMLSLRKHIGNSGDIFWAVQLEDSISEKVGLNCVRQSSWDLVKEKRGAQVRGKL